MHEKLLYAIGLLAFQAVLAEVSIRARIRKDRLRGKDVRTGGSVLWFLRVLYAGAVLFVGMLLVAPYAPATRRIAASVRTMHDGLGILACFFLAYAFVLFMGIAKRERGWGLFGSICMAVAVVLWVITIAMSLFVGETPFVVAIGCFSVGLAGLGLVVTLVQKRVASRNDEPNAEG